MKPRWKRGRIVTRSIICLLAVVAVLLFGPHEKESPHELGEKLLLAVDEHNWARVKTLLEEGADPNLTSFTPPKDPGPFWGWLYNHGLPNPDWRVRIERHMPTGFVSLWTPADEWKRDYPIVQAIEQHNVDAVKLLLEHKAYVGAGLIDIVQSNNADQIAMFHLLLDNSGGWKNPYAQLLGLVARSGNRRFIEEFEDLSHVPIAKRSISRMPFAPGAEKAGYDIIPGTEGALPTSHLLWVSPHELLLARGRPVCFSLLDLATGNETDLRLLSEKWAAQEQFVSTELALSPDGKWLLGFAGTKAHPTWLATEVHGAGFQEWNRMVYPPDGLLASSTPDFGWLDNRRWLAMDVANSGMTWGSYYRSLMHWFVRLRSLGEKNATQFPLHISWETDSPTYAAWSPVLLTFINPNEGLVRGEVTTQEVNPPPNAEARRITTAAWAILKHGPDGYSQREKDIVMNSSPYSGDFVLCATSPDGKHLAWLNTFEDSEAKDLVLTDPQGKDARIVYELLYPIDNTHPRRDDEAPLTQMLEWTPEGDGLIFWTGRGLARLPLTPAELH